MEAIDGKGRAAAWNRLGILALTAFSVIGAFKGLPFMRGLPDATLVLTGLSVVFLVVSLALPSRGQRSIALLWVFLIPGVVVQALNGGDMRKSLYLFSFTLLSCIVLYRLVKGIEDAWLYIRFQVILGLIMLVALQLFPSVEFERDFGRSNIDGGTSIATARVLAAGAVCALLSVVSFSRRILQATALVAGSGLGIAAISVGSRGPVVALVSALVAAFAFSRVAGVRRIRGIALGCGVLLVLLVALSAVNSQASARVLSAFLGQGDEARSYLLDVALQGIAENSAGIGWGSYEVLLGITSPSDSTPPYPHNFVVEVLLENGWVGGACVIGWVGYAIFRCWQRSGDPLMRALLGVTVFWVVNALFSSDINGNRPMWQALTVIFAVLCAQDRDGASTKVLNPAVGQQHVEAPALRP